MTYCTYLTVYFGDKLPRRYIGSSSLKKILDGYNGSVSSKKWKSIYDDEQLNNKHLFKTRVLTRHSTSREARTMEKSLQLKYNVVKSTLYFNESIARPNGFFGRDVSGENNPMFGSSRTGEKHKGGENISAALKIFFYETDRGIELREKTSKRFKENNPASDPDMMHKIKRTWKDTNRNIGDKNGMFGKHGATKDKIMYNNGSVVKAFFEHEVPSGWVKGRIKKEK